MASKRIKIELEKLKKNPLSFCTIETWGEDLPHFVAIMAGPENGPYSGGKFVIDVKFSAEYPFRPPKVTFMTKICHPNIDNVGNILLPIIYEDWSPAMTISKVANFLLEHLLCSNIYMQRTDHLGEIRAHGNSLFTGSIQSPPPPCIPHSGDVHGPFTVAKQDVLESIYSLLAKPCGDDPVMYEIGLLCRTNQAEFEKMARVWTKQYAM